MSPLVFQTAALARHELQPLVPLFLNLCKSHKGIEFFGVSGSHGRGEGTPTSDIDLAIVGALSASDFEDIRCLIASLANNLPIKIHYWSTDSDLIPYNTLFHLFEIYSLAFICGDLEKYVIYKIKSKNYIKSFRPSLFFDLYENDELNNKQKYNIKSRLNYFKFGRGAPHQIVFLKLLKLSMSSRGMLFLEDTALLYKHSNVISKKILSIRNCFHQENSITEIAIEKAEYLKSINYEIYKKIRSTFSTDDLINNNCRHRP
ncbi:putative nucleotidyltransferase [Asticcacaulis solisilvae]|nr:putative nucleotidyltransferase [Asticcacaulis solisilvae]MDR6801340.1 putative nucleotidyltransferase [Asticcacaulis sp. BE141]